MHDQCHQKVDCPMSDVLKFLAFNFAGAHQTRWRAPLQDLDIGLLIERQDNFVTLKQLIHPFIEQPLIPPSFHMGYTEDRHAQAGRPFLLAQTRLPLESSDELSRIVERQSESKIDANNRPSYILGNRRHSPNRE